jgi:sulfonate transport system substrate-binding protein
VTNASPTETLRIGGVPEHFNIPWRLALAAPLTLGGIPVSWQDCPSGTGQMCRALEAGELDVAILLTEGIVKHIHGGGTARIVGTYTASPLTWGVHVAADGPIRTMAQLQGARYAISRPGSGSNLMAALDAAQRGWPEPDYVPVGDLAGGVRALEAGTADAFMWEKTMSLPFVLDGQWRRVADFAGPWPAFVVAASPSGLQKAEGRLPDLLERVDAECRGARERIAETAETIRDDYRIPAEAVLDWLDETQWDCRATVSATMLDHVAQTLGDAGILARRLPAAEMVAPSTELR